MISILHSIFMFMLYALGILVLGIVILNIVGSLRKAYRKIKAGQQESCDQDE